MTDETCPPPPRLKAYDQEQCFLPPHAPEPNPLYAWKRKCQETVDSFIAPDVVAFPKNMGGPGYVHILILNTPFIILFKL
jgi:hypothetical protein